MDLPLDMKQQLMQMAGIKDVKEFDEIKKGNFHDKLFAKIKENNFINFETGDKIPKETIDLLYKILIEIRYGPKRIQKIHAVAFGQIGQPDELGLST